MNVSCLLVIIFSCFSYHGSTAYVTIFDDDLVMIWACCKVIDHVMIRCFLLKEKGLRK